MNKNFLSLCFGILIILSTTGCFSDSQMVDKDTVRNIPEPKPSIKATVPIETEKHETNKVITIEAPDNNGDFVVKAWQEAYVEFLCDFQVANDKEKAYYSLRDLDNDDVPELMIQQRNGSESNYSILTVFSYSDSFYKTGDYKLMGAGGLHISDNLEFPGLFHVTWGGGDRKFLVSYC